MRRLVAAAGMLMALLAAPAAKGVRSSRRIVFGVRRGKVSFVATVGPKVARSRRLVRAYVRLAGLRS